MFFLPCNGGSSICVIKTVVLLGNWVSEIVNVFSDTALECAGKQYENRDIDSTWRDLLLESRLNAEADFQPLLRAIKDGGWVTKHILLSPKEKCGFSILDQ